MRPFLRAVFPLLTLVAGPALAATDIGAAVRACRSESDDARRLACYDRVVDGTRATAPAAAAAPKSATPVAAAVVPAAATAAPVAAATSAEENFGREHQIAAEERKQQQDVARALGALDAIVIGIETRKDGLMTFTLDNGQVWRQNSLDSKFRLRDGDRVKIQPGSMNSFILSGPTKKSTRVTRVR